MWTKRLLPIMIIVLFCILPNPTIEYNNPPIDTSIHPNDNVIISDGEQWLQGFPYRKNHTILGSIGAGTDYQVEIEVHSGEGIDAGNLVNLPSSEWIPSDPIRFTDNDGITLLDYWKESTTGDGATYWVKISDNLDADVMLYLYYGNSTAPSLSNGTATFLFFDDFENGDLNRWDSVGTHWSATTSEVKHGTYAAYYDQLVTGDTISVNLTSEVSGIMIHNWYRAETLRGGSIGFYATNHGSTEAVRAYDYKWKYFDGVSRNDYGPNNHVNAVRWDRCEVGIDLSNYEMKLWVNKTYLGSAAHIYDTSGTNVTSTENIYQVYISTQTGYEHWVDDYFVRKWVASEPQHGGWGDGTNWLDDFPYRKKHSLNGSTGAGADYQVQIKVHSGSGTDSGNTVYLGSNQWTPSDTVRFTGKDGITLLDYWKESSDADNATFWVEVKDDLDYGTDIYLYYGNSTAPDLSNGTTTFNFFDDFENGDLSRWDSVGSEWSISSTIKKQGSYSAIGNSTSAPSSSLQKNQNITHGCLFHVWYYVPTSGTTLTYPLVTLDEAGDSVLMLIDYGFNQLRYLRGVDNSQWPSYSTYSDAMWFRLELGYDFVNDMAYAWNDGNSMGSTALLDYPGGGDVASISAFQPATSSSSKTTYMDDYFVRKWVPNEPAHGEWGMEESREGPYKAGGAPWLEDWPYRRYHAINGSLGAGTDYQVQIHIHSGPGTDSGNLVNLPSSQWTPSQPVRFTDNDGITLLDYWKECSDEENATYWVEIKDSLDTSVVIYFYYGNYIQSSLSNGSATFLFFDDFENGNLDRWDSVGTHWSSITTEKKYGSYSLYFDQVAGDSITANFSSAVSGMMIHSWYRAETLRGGAYDYWALDGGSARGLRAHDYRWQYFDGTSYTYYGTDNSVDAVRWDRCELGIDLHSSTMKLWVNRTYIGQATDVNNAGGTPLSTSDQIYRIQILGQTNYQHWADDVYVRKWIPNEPQHIGWIDESPPTIDTPEDLTYNEGTTGHNITWNPSDHYPAIYHITRNGTEPISGLWNSTTDSIYVSVDGLSAGVHNYTIIVVDAGENYVLDTVFIYVEDVTLPQISITPDVYYDEGESGYSISWNGTDLHPVGYTIYKDGVEIASGPWNSTSEYITTDVGLLSYGIYNYTVSLVDIGGNLAYDTVFVFVADGTKPAIDNPNDLEIAEGASVQYIVWNPSDMHPSNYTILFDSNVARFGIWNASLETISVSIEGLGLGNYNYTLVVRDIDGNSAVDTVIVTIQDQTVPSISSPSDFSYYENVTGNFISWTVSDLHPSNYEILRNGTIIDFGVWTTAIPAIIFSTDGLTPSVWNITLVLVDTAGNSISDTVLVTVYSSSATTTSTSTTSTTTTSTSGDTSGAIMLLAASVGGAFLFIMIIGLFLMKRKSKVAGISPSRKSDIDALRGGEFVGNRFRFKVKVVNNSKQVITDVCVTLTSYPKDSLNLEADSSSSISKLEPKGFRSPTFEFLPTKDCVRGDLIATVSWVDANGEAHSTTTKPFTIRAVCDLLKPESITPDAFILKLATLGHGETMTKVNDWTPKEMHEKTVKILKDSNFFEVTSEVNPIGDHIEIGIQGWAKGMYTGKNLGVEITISGRPDAMGATCKVRVSGEDEAMILPAIDEISQKLGAWLCPRCGGVLPIDAVKELKGGSSVECPFCSVAIDR